MELHKYSRLLMLSLFTACFSLTLHAQRYLSDYDSSFFIRDTVRPFLQRMENLHFSGYIQPQFQVAQSKGAPSYAGGNFADSSNNRFMLRRARIKVDYILPAKGKAYPMALFTFQFDITERGAFARDVFFRLYEPKSQRLSFTMGLFARPFGYEVNLSSGYRESPERGRMSQILMPAERDLGAMASFESKKVSDKKPMFKFDIGAFNGPGLSATTDYDSYKDLISRLTLKPFALSRKLFVSAGLSFLRGGWEQASHYRYGMGSSNGNKLFIPDSSIENWGSQLPRHYYGGDVQLAFKHRMGKTEIRAEYWQGTQPGTATTTVNPGALPLVPAYVRPFNGAFLYFLQNIVNPQWELVLKYDWYDPNREIEGADIGKAGTNFTAADIKFSTLGFGVNHYFNDNVKVIAYYDFIKNEKTSLAGFNGDIKDDVFTLRFQLRF
jgi:hypothetical protein